ncbi:MAG TPA: hypothetical protein VE196_02945, partial [Pseudonocardiaceae bacterium]|nr:hypothetical protein [Pseudonocardiaceae bacterium]
MHPDQVDVGIKQVQRDLAAGGAGQPRAAAEVSLSGEQERALRLAEEAVSTARGLPARPVLAMALTRAAETALLAGQPRTAADILVELLGVVADLGGRRWVADALETAALVLEAEQDTGRAAAILGAS